MGDIEGKGQFDSVENPVASAKSGDWNWLIIILGVCLFQSCSDSSSNKYNISELKREVRSLERKNDSLTLKNQSLENRILGIETDRSLKNVN